VGKYMLSFEDYRPVLPYLSVALANSASGCLAKRPYDWIPMPGMVGSSVKVFWLE
jgi:hypothetical protein